MDANDFCTEQIRQHLAAFGYDPLSASSTAPRDPVLGPLEVLLRIRASALALIEERLRAQVHELECDAQHARNALKHGRTPDITGAAVRVRELSAAQHEARTAFTETVRAVAAVLKHHPDYRSAAA